MKSLLNCNYFFDYFFKAYKDVRDLGNLRLAVVGPATAKKLKDLHLTVDASEELELTRQCQ